jgi:hypothetical protein
MFLLNYDGRFWNLLKLLRKLKFWKFNSLIITKVNRFGFVIFIIYSSYL